MDAEKKARILVVDDEPSLATTLALILRRAGFSAIAVNSGEEALALIATNQLSLVITDVIMPGMDGIALAKIIQKSYPNCPVLIFSGNADTQALLDAAKDEGHLFEVLAKPVSPPVMLAKVACLLELSIPAHHRSS